MEETQGTYDSLLGTDCFGLCLGKFPGNIKSYDYYYKLKW